MRAFIAIELPSELKRQLAFELESLRDAAWAGAIRWSSPETVHLTLRFLGELDQNEVQLAELAMQRTLASERRFAFRIRRKLGCFPSWRRPRVFWIGVSSGSDHLGMLHAALERELRDRGFEPERRRFHPHLTIGRVRPGAARPDLQSAAKALGDAELEELGEVEVSRISLMQSDLQPTGAVHTPVVEILLNGVEE